LTQKLKYLMLQSNNKEKRCEVKECYDVIMALLIAIEGVNLGNLVLDIWAAPAN
jgi:hypothetical protein